MVDGNTGVSNNLKNTVVKQIKEIYNYKTDERVQDLNAGGVLYLH